MPEYEWRNTQTNEVVSTDKHDVPPDSSGDWIRKYSFAAGNVEGAGGSPPKPSTKYTKD